MFKCVLLFVDLKCFFLKFYIIALLSFWNFLYVFTNHIKFPKEDKISPEPESVEDEKKKKKKKKHKKNRSVLQVKLGKLALQIGYVGK